ncbi:MAG: helix-turn-helix domain-containing protein [Planctomycetes bacterium]|nr:helix-turn-helix domain-containing protein [Planctomycetota bacterium]
MTSNVRDDYNEQKFITYDEAAMISGLSKSRVKSLASEIKEGRRLFGKGNVVGPYRIDRESFEEFLRSGLPCGPEHLPE